MNTENFEQFKKVYKDIQPPEYLAKKGWDDLSHRLPTQDRQRMPILKYGFMFAGLLLFLSAGVIGVSQSAQPGTALYPIKSASEQISQTFTKTIMHDPDKIPAVTLPTPKKVKPTVTPTPEVSHTPTPTKKPVNPTSVPTTVKKAPQVQNNAIPNSSLNNNNNSSNSNNQNPGVAGVKTEKPNENKEQKEKQEQKQNNSGNQGNGNSKKN